MTKKLFTLLLAVAASVGTIFAWDYEHVQIGELYYNLDATNHTAEVTHQNSNYPYWSTTITTANIPSSVTYNSVTYSVTSIGDDAFYRCTGLTSVTIPNSVTSIGFSAFFGCTGLTSITIPNSVTSIGYYAFHGCSGLTSVAIPNSVTTIGGSAFSGCSGLTSIIVENGNSFYDSRNNCNAIIETATNTLIVGCKNTIIPNSVTTIGGSAFSGCSGLTSITIPNSVTSIGDWAFESCTGLTSVIWNAKNCADFASNNTPFYANYHDEEWNYDFSFDIRPQITSFTFGNEVEHIPANLCNGMSNLTSIEIPNSVTSIGNSAFEGCSGLTSVTIPNSVTSIGVQAFRECSGLTSITIPNSVTSIGGIAFYGCTGLTSITIPNSVTTIGYYAFYGCTGLTSVTIGNSVTSIGEGAFVGCTGLTSITIPNSVTTIGYGAFTYCPGLTSFTNYATNPQLISADVFEGVDISTCTLYVPAESIALYQAADVWKEFFNILPIEGELPIEPTEGEFNVLYIGHDGDYISSEEVTLHLPVAPVIEGFLFVGWQTVSAMLTEGIIIQAVYQAEEPTSAPAVYTNPANPAQKLIRNGNVYILRDDKVYTVTGQTVK